MIELERLADELRQAHQRSDICCAALAIARDELDKAKDAQNIAYSRENVAHSALIKYVTDNGPLPIERSEI